MDNIKFGEFIKQLRKEKNMTQKVLAEKLNITDKAVSKWERGLSFPDLAVLNSLSEVFDINISELLNGEKGNIENINIEKVISEAKKESELKQEESKKRKEKSIKRVSIISFICFILFSILQLGYVIILNRFGFEYVIDWLYNLVNEIIIISFALSIFYFIRKQKIIKTITFIMIALLTSINAVDLYKNGFVNKCIVSFSNNFSNQLIIKQNKATGETNFYRNEILLFARPKEQFSKTVKGKIKTQWLTTDICAITYMDVYNDKNTFVATYGDRSEGFSYYNIIPAIQGNWQLQGQYADNTKVKVEGGNITIIKNNEEEIFEYSKVKQFGTIAIVLYKNYVPKYVIALNKDCKLDETTDIIKEGGTITLCEVSMDKTAPDRLFCITPKYQAEKPQEEKTFKEEDLAKEMDDIIQKDPKLHNYQSIQNAVKIVSNDEDIFYLARLGLEENDKQFAINGVDKSVKINKIEVIAKSIEDDEWLIKIQTTEKYNSLNSQSKEISIIREETGNYTWTYRMKKAQGAYLFVFINQNYDKGNHGLIELDPVLEKDTKEDAKYQYDVPAIKQ